MKKLFLAMMAVATIAMVGCKKEGGNTPTPTPPTPTPDPGVLIPDVETVEGAIVVAAYIPDGICKDVFMEGAYEGWSIDKTIATKFEAIEDFENWYYAVIEIPEGTRIC